MSVRSYIIAIFAIFIIIVFSGCAPKYIDVNKSLFEGKSVVVVPTYYSQGLRMYWGKLGNKKLYNHEKINSYYHNLNHLGKAKKYFEYDFLIDADYQVLAVESGVYYISEAYVSIPEMDYPLKLPTISTNTKEFKSTIGNIWVKKTPERERDSRGKRQEVVSYYQMEYDFVDNANINNPKSIGTITINPNEIVLIPSVWVDIEIADDSCKFENEQWFLFDILDVVATPSKIFYGNDEDTWYWDCPIKSIIINIKTKPIDNLLDEIASSPFSLKDFENITTRNFKFGNMFKNAKKIENLEDGVERYIIDGSTNKSE
jgi:hypothetical protein